MEDFVRLYLITNIVNNKEYVGITNGSVQDRFTSHLRESARPRVPLHLAMAKHGATAFRVEELGQASSREELCRMERDEITRRGCTAPAGYNLTPGGDGQAPGYVASEATRAKLGSRAREAWARLTPEERRARSAAISAAKKGHAPRHGPGKKSLVGYVRDDAFKAKVSAGVKRMVEDLEPGEMSRRSRCRKKTP